MYANRYFMSFLVVGALLLVAQSMSASEPPPYGIIDLGVLPGQPESHARARGG